MRVLILTDGFLPYVVQLANALAERNEVALLIGASDVASPAAVESEASRDSSLIRKILSERIPVTWLQYPRRRDPRSLLVVRRAIARVREWDPDVIHVQESFDYRTLLMVWGVRPSHPVVVTVHDVRIHAGEEHKYKTYTLWVRNRLRHLADELIVHGEQLRRLLTSDMGINVERIHVCPHGQFSFFRRWAKPEAIEEDHSVLFFGRIWPYKGLEDLIQAEPLITKEIPEARIVIAGQGEDFRRYDRLMVNRDRFLILNRMIPYDMAASLFQRSRVVALPYREASQSGVIPIAYAFGKPVVATRVGSIPEVVDDGETGYLVSPRDPQALAEAIVRILSDRALREVMGRNARRKAMEEMSWTSIAQKTARIYQKAIQARAEP